MIRSVRIFVSSVVIVGALGVGSAFGLRAAGADVPADGRGQVVCNQTAADWRDAPAQRPCVRVVLFEDGSGHLVGFVGGERKQSIPFDLRPAH
jgi:hypothetical protein